MTHKVGQDLSYHYLIDPTPEDRFTESDYLHAINTETIFRVTEYSYEKVEEDLKHLFPDELPHHWAEDYFHWWMEEKKISVMNQDPSFYDPIEASQWEGEWSVGVDYNITSVVIKQGKKKTTLTQKDFESAVQQNGSYTLGSLTLNSWDEVLEVAATYPNPLGKIKIGTYTVINDEKIALYQQQLSQKRCMIPPSPSGILQDSDLPNAEIYFQMTVDSPVRLKMPFAGGWVALEYEKGATISAHFDLQNHYANIDDGETLVSFDGVYVSLRPEQVIDLLKQKWGIQLPKKWDKVVDAIVDQTKDYYRVPLASITAFGGRPHLGLDFSKFPHIGGNLPFIVFVEMSLPAGVSNQLPNSLAQDVLGDESFRLSKELNSYLLLKTASEALSYAQNGRATQGILSHMIPHSYRGNVWIRSLHAGKKLPNPHPLLGEKAEVIDGRLRIDFDSMGGGQFEGHLPVAFLRDAANPSGPQSFATMDFRIQTDDSKVFRGWSEIDSNKLPNLMGGPFQSAHLNLFFSDATFNPNALSPSDLISEMINQFELELIQSDQKALLVQGAALLVRQDSQFYVSGNGDVLEVFDMNVTDNDLAVSVNGIAGDPTRHFELSGLKFELVDGMTFEVIDVIGSSEQSEDEVSFYVRGIFNFEAKGIFTAQKQVTYEGEILFNRKDQTYLLADVEIPLPDMMLSVHSEEEVHPFRFSGELKGNLVFDTKREEVRGPFALQGSLTYLNDAQQTGLPFLPSWIEFSDSFSAHLPIQTIIYHPKDKRLLREFARQLEKGENANALESIDEITLQINRLSKDPSRGILADLLVDAKSISLAYHEREEPRVADQTESADVTSIPQPLVVKSETVSLHDWDLYLDEYGLDRERALMMLTMMENTRDAHITVDGFELNLPPSRMIQMGLIPVYVPKGTVPVLDIRIVDGQIEHYHFYFSKPLGIPPLIRGIYFDKDAGKFRLDLINNGDSKRSADLYKVAKGDPAINKKLFKMLPLPEEIRDELLAEADLNPEFLDNDGSKWLMFLLLYLVAKEKSLLTSDTQKKKKSSLFNTNGTQLNIHSMQLKPGTTFHMAGVDFEFGCEHEEAGPDHDCGASNVLSGYFSLTDGVAHLSFDEVDYLKITVPKMGEDSDVLSLDLRDGSIREVDVTQEPDASVLTIYGMNFEHSVIRGNPFEENLNLKVISNLEVNELELRRETRLENDVITVRADFAVDLEEGDLRYREGEREAHFELDRSHIHVQSLIQFEEVVRSADGRRGSAFNPMASSSLPVVDTILKEGEFVITSDELAYKSVSFTPGIEFGPSTTRDARIILRSEKEGGGKYLRHEGRMDWNLNRPVTIPIAQTQLIRGIAPDVTFDYLRVSGDGYFEFKDDKVSFGSIENDEALPFLVTYDGSFLVERSTEGALDKKTEMRARFSGSNELRFGVFSLEEEREGFPLHIEEVVSTNLNVAIQDLGGTLYIESPSSTGWSAFSVEEGEGMFAVNEVHLKEGDHTYFKGLILDIQDYSRRKNSVFMQGDLSVHPYGVRFYDIEIKGTFFDELNNTSLPGIEIISHPQMSWWVPIHPQDLSTEYRLAANSK